MTVETGANDSEDVPMAISPDGETFVVGHGNTLRRCRVRRGKVAQTTAVETGPLSRIAFHPESLLYATADASPIVSVWEIESGNRTRSFELPFQAVKSLVFSLDGDTCAAGGDGREFAV